jgi:hypothetical protein
MMKVRNNNKIKRIVQIIVLVILLYATVDYMPSINGKVVDDYTGKGIPYASVCQKINGPSLLPLPHPVTTEFRRKCLEAKEDGSFVIPSYLFFRPFSKIDVSIIMINRKFAGEGEENFFYETWTKSFEKSNFKNNLVVSLRPSKNSVRGCENELDEQMFNECYYQVMFSSVLKEKEFLDGPICNYNGICEENEFLYSCSSDCDEKVKHEYMVCHNDYADPIIKLVHNDEILDNKYYLKNSFENPHDNCKGSSQDCIACNTVEDIKFPVFEVSFDESVSRGRTFAGRFSFRKAFIDSTEVRFDETYDTKIDGKKYYPYKDIYDSLPKEIIKSPIETLEVEGKRIPLFTKSINKITSSPFKINGTFYLNKSSNVSLNFHIERLGRLNNFEFKINNATVESVVDGSNLVIIKLNKEHTLKGFNKIEIIIKDNGDATYPTFGEYPLTVHNDTEIVSSSLEYAQFSIIPREEIKENSCWVSDGSWDLLPGDCDYRCNFPGLPGMGCDSSISFSCQCGEDSCWDGDICEKKDQWCWNGGGVWRQFTNYCVDLCVYDANYEGHSSICEEVLTDGCDCGPDSCWDGTICRTNYPPLS